MGFILRRKPTSLFYEVYTNAHTHTEVNKRLFISIDMHIQMYNVKWPHTTGLLNSDPHD